MIDPAPFEKLYEDLLAAARRQADRILEEERVSNRLPLLEFNELIQSLSRLTYAFSQAGMLTRDGQPARQDDETPDYSKLTPDEREQLAAFYRKINAR